MDRAVYTKRPDWWPDWIPESCPACGARFLPGTVRVGGWDHCDCPGAGPAQGHHQLFCATGNCHWSMWPPEHEPTSS